MAAILGVDVGGTFTDFFLFHDGRLEVFKRPSTPADPSRAVLAGLEEAGLQPDDVVHGSTVATNALLTRRGACTALVTTKGFRDAIVIGRQARRDMYALEPTRPEPLVPDNRRFEVDERVDAAGNVLVALTSEEVERAVAEVCRSGAESVAVCLLFSFLYPEHEQRITAALRERGLLVSASVEVLPEYREYERLSTTAVNAYLSPIMTRYLERLRGGLREKGVRRLRVMQNDGGSLTAELAGRLAARTVLSGPAGGVTGAHTVAKAAGYGDVITFDMGGTSTDVSLCPGRAQYRSDLLVDGLPVRTPAVDIHTVGAGGGSIAFLDLGAALRVGPESAGADPGPACYGSGTSPTVTDAQVLLGRIRPAFFLGGRLPIDAGAARRAIATLRAPGQRGRLDALAAAVLSVANANMERAIRVISVERGFDPRDFSLFAFGGAGPLHACDLAEALDIPRVIVPPFPGVLSAYGMAVADTTRDYVAPVLRQIENGPQLVEVIKARFAEMERNGRLEIDARPGATLLIERSLDLRYAGQSYELEVPIASYDQREWSTAFHAAHATRYGYARAERAVEIVNARVRLRVPGHVPPPQALPVPASPATPIEIAQVWFGRRRPVPIYRREALGQGTALAGPAIIVQMDSTTVVNPGWHVRVDGAGNLIVESR